MGNSLNQKSFNSSELTSVSTDVFDPVKRSQIMASVKGANTKPEVYVRSHLHRAGFRFRLHGKNLPGRPDIVLAGLRTIAFVHGCFWHGHPGCKRAALPKGNLNYWTRKIARNVERDKTNQERLSADGWKVEVLWECEIKRKLPELIERLTAQRMTTRQANLTSPDSSSDLNDITSENPPRK